MLALFSSLDTWATSISLWWIWVMVALLIACALGFLAGLRYAEFQSRRACQRAAREVSRLLEVVLKRLDDAREACAALEQFPQDALTSAQAERLEQGRRSLQDQLRRLTAHLGRSLERTSVPPAVTDLRSTPLTWTLLPEDQHTGLPDRGALLRNLEMLLQAGRQCGQWSGVLLAKMDRLDSLRERFGPRDSQKLLKKLSLILCCAVRDGDLVCQYAHDTFAVLLPAVEPAEGERIAATLRDAVRNYHFRLSEHGEEILVTASMGYTATRAEDTADFVLNRALDALLRSQRVGRNQLHIHDGQSVTHCLANSHPAGAV